MDEYALVGTSSESTSKSVSLDGARRMALKHIEAFVLTFSDPHAFAAAAASSAPAALSQVTEGARIQEAGHLRCRFPFSLSLSLSISQIVVSILPSKEKRNGNKKLQTCSLCSYPLFYLLHLEMFTHHSSISWSFVILLLCIEFSFFFFFLVMY